MQGYFAQVIDKGTGGVVLTMPRPLSRADAGLFVTTALALVRTGQEARVDPFDVAFVVDFRSSIAGLAGITAAMNGEYLYVREDSSFWQLTNGAANPPVWVEVGGDPPAGGGALVVSSLNALTGAVVLEAGANFSIAADGGNPHGLVLSADLSSVYSKAASDARYAPIGAVGGGGAAVSILAVNNSAGGAGNTPDTVINPTPVVWTQYGNLALVFPAAAAGKTVLVSLDLTYAKLAGASGDLAVNLSLDTPNNVKAANKWGLQSPQQTSERYVTFVNFAITLPNDGAAHTIICVYQAAGSTAATSYRFSAMSAIYQ